MLEPFIFQIYLLWDVLCVQKNFECRSFLLHNSAFFFPHFFFWQHFRAFHMGRSWPTFPKKKLQGWKFAIAFYYALRVANSKKNIAVALVSVDIPFISPTKCRHQNVHALLQKRARAINSTKFVSLPFVPFACQRGWLYRANWPTLPFYFSKIANLIIKPLIRRFKVVL